jgi:hypothetical protein
VYLTHLIFSVHFILRENLVNNMDFERNVGEEQLFCEERNG